MNPKEIIRHTPPIFPAVEDWRAFNELISARTGIINEWFRIASLRVRENVIRNPRPGWSFEPWGSDVDTKFYLEEFGQGSLFVGFGWSFELHLYLGDHGRFNGSKADELLKTSRFSPILGGFERIDRAYEKNAKAMHYRNFHFGSVHDGNIPMEELAWYAGNRTEEFVEQAVRQLDRFMGNAEVTEALRDLNREIQIATRI